LPHRKCCIRLLFPAGCDLKRAEAPVSARGC
jgi:hypothetical protein